MNGQQQETSLRYEVVVQTSLERAFHTFTHEFDRIKPREHNLLTVPIAARVFEPHTGGRIYDRGVDGSVCQWARVLAYEPPHRVVFSWDIGLNWQIESDPQKSSEVEVQFTAEAPDRTRVELVHRNLDRHGPGWESMRDGVGADHGWPLYLQRYIALLPAVS
ncbi:MAG TPA: SRPBCC family protein [Dehalococcoidia bacterium]|nr:SRPBCC family protein [Dehalococcoidia bacterium]